MSEIDPLPSNLEALQALFLKERERSSALLNQLEETSSQLGQKETELKATNIALHHVSKENMQLKYVVAELERQLFGRKMERLPEEMPNQLKLFEANEAPVLPDAHQEGASTPSQSKKKTTRKGRKKGGSGRQKLPENLQRIEVTSSESGPTSCSCCGGDLKLIGYDNSERLERIPSHHVVLLIKRAKRACPKCPSEGVLLQPAPPFSMERSKYADGFVAQVLVDKFADHLPLRRQQKRLKRDGLHIPISNLCRIVQHSAGLLKHVVQVMQQELLNGPFIQGDETGLPILVGEKNRPIKGTLWIYTDGEQAVFEATLNKAGKNPKEFLKGFKGVFLPDGASTFNAACSSIDVTRAGCWSHARRKFFEARNQDPRALEALVKIKHLFLYEREAWQLDEDARQRFRDLNERPWVKQFYQWVRGQQATAEPNLPFYKALQYVLNQEDCLTVFLEHPNTPIHNNTSERGLRGSVIGRKNWMFAGSVAGAEAAATQYSIIKSCEMVGIDPFAYLRDVLPRLPWATPNVLRQMTPKEWAKRHLKD